MFGVTVCHTALPKPEPIVGVVKLNEFIGEDENPFDGSRSYKLTVMVADALGFGL